MKIQEGRVTIQEGVVIGNGGNKKLLADIFSPPLEAKNRLKDKANDRMESLDLDFYNKVRNGYLEIADRFPERVKIIDASKPIQEVQAHIVEYLKELVKNHGN